MKFLEELKTKRENRPHIELPEVCLVPSDEEIARVRAEFDEYWGNHKTEPVWHKNGKKVMNRIMKEIKANINVLSQMTEQSMNMFFDQWLASVYHANANREGSFGDRAWNFYTFDFPPEWTRKKRNEWFHEISEKSSGKIERWIFNKDDYLASSAVYHDIKTGTVLLYLCDEELFDKALEEFSPFFDQKHCEVVKMSMSLATMIKNNKKEKLLQRFEKGF